MSFQIGDLIAHPLHGAGVISGIENRRINGRTQSYYTLKISIGDILVLVPVDSCDKVGIRPVIARDTADDILSRLRNAEIEVNQNWNKRYRENMLRIRSGDLFEVAAVIKSLHIRDRERGLSTGERKMLNCAKQILLSELVLSLGGTYEEAESRLAAAI